MSEGAQGMIAVARRLAGTPFMHKGRGPAFDCLGLVAAAYEESIGEFAIDWPDYGAPWHHQAHGEIGHEFLTAVFEPAPKGKIEAGDVLVFDLGARRHWHLGIADGEGKFWHAHLRRGVEAEVLSSDWLQKIDAVYRLSEVEDGNFTI